CDDHGKLKGATQNHCHGTETTGFAASQSLRWVPLSNLLIKYNFCAKTYHEFCAPPPERPRPRKVYPYSPTPNPFPEHTTSSPFLQASYFLALTHSFPRIFTPSRHEFSRKPLLFRRLRTLAKTIGGVPRKAFPRIAS